MIPNMAQFSKILKLATYFTAEKNNVRVKAM